MKITRFFKYALQQALNLFVVKHRFITHEEKTTWGTSIYFIEKSGKALARTYWYDEDSSVVILEGLHVEKESRQKGIATKLLKMHLEIAKKNKASSQLKVEENSWIQLWYKRLGYKDFIRSKEDNMMWMIMLP